MRLQRWRHGWRGWNTLVVARTRQIAVQTALTILQFAQHVGEVTLHVALARRARPFCVRRARWFLRVGHFSLDADLPHRVFHACLPNDFGILSRRALGPMNLSLHRHLLPLIVGRRRGRTLLLGRPKFTVLRLPERNLISKFYILFFSKFVPFDYYTIHLLICENFWIFFFNYHKVCKVYLFYKVWRFTNMLEMILFRALVCTVLWNDCGLVRIFLNVLHRRKMNEFLKIHFIQLFWINTNF